VDKHNKTVATLNKNVEQYAYNLYIYQQEKTTSTERQQIINNNVSHYNNLIISTKQLLNTENNNFNSAIYAADNKIKIQKDQLATLSKTDVNLIDVVETVQGSVFITWVSIADIITLYVPYYKIIIIVCVILMALFLIYVRPRSLNYID